MKESADKLQHHDRLVSLRPVPRSKFYVVWQDYAFVWDGMTTVVPERFRFDGASIPPFAWRFTTTPYDQRTIRAALVHDYLYTTRRMNGDVEIDQKKADRILLAIMEADGVGPIRRRLVYRAVRWFGGRHWRKKLTQQRVALGHAVWAKQIELRSGRITAQWFELYGFPPALMAQP